MLVVRTFPTNRLARQRHLCITNTSMERSIPVGIVFKGIRTARNAIGMQGAIYIPPSLGEDFTPTSVLYFSLYRFVPFLLTLPTNRSLYKHLNSSVISLARNLYKLHVGVV